MTKQRKGRTLSQEEKKLIKNLGAQLQKQRNNLGLTLEDLEGRGYPRWQHVMEIEHGKRELVSLISLYRLSKALGVPLWKLIQQIE